MPNRKSYWVNAYESALAVELPQGDTSMTVADGSALPSGEFYLVIEPANATQREYVWVTSRNGNILNGMERNLNGSAGDVTHPVNSVVRTVALAQGFEDLHLRADAAAQAVPNHEADPDPHGQYLLEADAAGTYLTQVDAAATYLPLAGGTLTGVLTLAGGPVGPLEAATRQYVDDGLAGLSNDHGDLTGLADDDHPQYFNQTRGDARYVRLAADSTVTANVDITNGADARLRVDKFNIIKSIETNKSSSNQVALLQDQGGGEYALVRSTTNFALSSHTHPWSQITGVPTASTSSQGIVQLANAVGTSITRAATQALANTIWAKANEVDSGGGDVSSGQLRVTSNAIFQALGTGSRKTTINELLAGIVTINSGLSVNQVTASALWPYNNQLSTVRYPASTTGVIHQAYTSSSEQDKKYIQPVREEDAIFDRLNPVWFKYKADHPLRKFYSSEEEYQRFENPDSIGRMGFIAEEVREVAPHWVLEREDVGLGIAFEGMLPDFTAWAVARIQQLVARVTELEAQLV